VFAHACKLGLEGIVSKRAGQPLSERDEPQLAEVPEPGVREDMSPAPGRVARGNARGATIALRHDEAIPHKLGCGAKATQAPVRIATGKGAKAQKIGLKNQARPLVKAA
jgi:hypothetical protein